MNKTKIGLIAIVVPFLLSLLKSLNVPCSGMLMCIGTFSLAVFVGILFFKTKFGSIFPSDSPLTKFQAECEADFEDRKGYDDGQERNEKLTFVGSTVLGQAISFLCIGILFTCQHWPGSKPMVMLSCAGFVGSLVFAFFLLKEDNCVAHKDIKMLSVVGLLASLIGLSSSFWTYIDCNYYKDCPHLVEVIKAANENPTDENLNAKSKEFEKRRMFGNSYNEMSERGIKTEKLAASESDALVMYVAKEPFNDNASNKAIDSSDDYPGFRPLQNYLSQKVQEEDITESTHIYLITKEADAEEEVISLLGELGLKGIKIDNILVNE